MKKTDHFILGFPQRRIESDIFIGRGVLEKIPRMLDEKRIAARHLLLTDSTVHKLYGKELHKKIVAGGLQCQMMVVPQGERSKDRRTKEKIEDFMLANGYGRDSAILALGGGVVGDLGGFVAATYMRGIPFIQLPTTLLSMVDSSIGGKTAVNHPLGKNMIGAFHQPRMVVADTGTLETLSMRHYREGLAEAVKLGAIQDRSLFNMIEKNARRLARIDHTMVARIIVRCARLKGRIVRLDEREKRLRKTLNFGHTIAHALENLSSYAIRHGEAVAMGMVVEGELSRRLRILSDESQERLIRLLRELSLPVTIPPRFKAEDLMTISRKDKKARRGRTEYTLIGKIGFPADRRRITMQVDDRAVIAAINGCIARRKSL